MLAWFSLTSYLLGIATTIIVAWVLAHFFKHSIDKDLAKADAALAAVREREEKNLLKIDEFVRERFSGSSNTTAK